MAAKGKTYQTAYSRDVELWIQKIKSILADRDIQYSQMILFGSQARGDARPDSDIDICLVIKRIHSDLDEVRLNVNKWVALAGIPADIVLTTTESLKNDHLSPLLHEIRKNGIEIK